jgi:S1-C subfamily serine protease
MLGIRMRCFVIYCFGIAAVVLTVAALGACQRDRAEKSYGRPERAAHPPATVREEVPDIPAKDLLITEQAFIKVAKRVTPSVVNISSVHLYRHPATDDAPGEGGVLHDLLGDLFGPPPQRNLRQKSLGSGFIISDDGLILTNNHVIAEADRITVRLSDGTEYVGQVVGKDPKSDLAVVRIQPEEPIEAVQMGNSEDLMVGEWAIAIGNPFGLDHTVTVGVISATGRTNLGLTDFDNFIQTDASINFGNSGGPLLNAKGEVIGINTAIVASGQGIGFAIPINAAREVIQDLIEKRKISHGWLGVRISDPPPLGGKVGNQGDEGEPRGVRVQEVIQRSPAERSGILKGDSIVLLDKSPVIGVRDFQRKMSRFHSGDVLELLLNRGEKKIELQVTLGENPSFSETSSLISP